MAADPSDPVPSPGGELPARTADTRTFDAFSFADALVSFGCTMRDHFTRTFASAWERLPRPPHIIDMNCTASIAGFLQRQFRIRERIAELTGSVVIDFPTETNIFAGEDEVDFFGANRGGDKFLGRYSVEELTATIASSPFGEGIQAAGIDDWYVEFDLRDSFVHYGYIRSRSFPEPEKFLAFLIVQIGEFHFKRPEQASSRGAVLLHTKLPPDLNMLNIRWFSLQNPLAEFSARKPRMPGQRYPGTGVGRRAFDLLRSLAASNGRDGIVNVPEHFHNAFLYEGFQFLNPDDEGTFQRMREDLAPDIAEKGLAALSWAAYLGFMRCAGEHAAWQAHEQVYPISGRLRRYFKAAEYTAAVEARKADAGRFSVEWAAAESYCLSAVLNFSPEEVRGNVPAA
jgi:hypothetical protein